MRKKLISLVLSLSLIVTLVPALALTARGANTDKLIAFTFDDGPSQYTLDLLDGLKDRGAHVTFFMNGVNGSFGASNHPDTLVRMRDEGHELCNHTYSHAKFGSLSGAEMQEEESKVERLLFDAMGGSYTDLVRTPGGAVNATVKSSVQAPIILWSVDTMDWKYRNEDTVYNNIMSEARDGSIVLMHDIYPTSVRGALRAVDSLQAQGYEFVTVAELMRRRQVELCAGTTYSSAYNQGVTLDAYTAPTLSVEQMGNGTAQITLTDGNGGLPLYYTTDGSTPNLGSCLYEGSITLSSDAVITAAGIDEYGTRTPVVSENVTVQEAVAPPDFLVSEGKLALTCATPGAAIYYTTDNSVPTEASTLYTEPFAPGRSTRFLAVSAAGTVSPVVSVISTETGAVFQDVPYKAWYYSAVCGAVDRGIMAGVGGFRFEPESVTTRGQLVTVLYQLAQSPAVSGGSGFSDVAADAWYADAVSWAAEHGIVSGVGGGRFEPDAPVLRQDMAVMLYHFAVWRNLNTLTIGSLNQFTDAGQVSDYAREALLWCRGHNVMNGVGGGLLSPMTTADRGQCASVMLRLSRLMK